MTRRHASWIAGAMIVALALAGCARMAPERPRSEVIVGDWITPDGYVLSIKEDGTATSDDPEYEDLVRAGATMRWSYDDATDLFRFGGTISGTGIYVGLEVTARWSGDDRVCFAIDDGECSPYWIRRGT